MKKPLNSNMWPVTLTVILKCSFLKRTVHGMHSRKKNKKGQAKNKKNKNKKNNCLFFVCPWHKSLKQQELCYPDVLQKRKADLFYSYFTKYLGAINSPAHIRLVCYLLRFHFLLSKKSDRGHFSQKVLNTAQWTALHGLMPHRVILLGAKFLKLESFSSCSCSGAWSFLGIH